MMPKVLIPLTGDDIAPRFDLAQEVMICVLDDKNQVQEQRIVVLSQASPEDLCELVLREKIDVLICCGIEEEFYSFLLWKKVDVYDSVIGSCNRILEEFRSRNLYSGAVLRAI
jgi:predicted Fe-Mo cluster-binding NifX family protein